MKKFIIAVMCVLCSFGAYATGENERATSIGYVTEELASRQDKFQKLGADTAMTYSGTTDGAVGSRTITGNLGAETNTSATTLPTVGGVNTKVANKQDELNFAANTVLMNTGVAGAPAAKGIYNDSGSYVEQTDSLIEAATFNAALQNAINSEFTCAQRKDPNDPNSKCLLFNIFAPVNPSKNLFNSAWLLEIPGWSENSGVYTGTIIDAFLFSKNSGFIFQNPFKPNTSYTLSYTMSSPENSSLIRGGMFFEYTDGTYQELDERVSAGETKNIISVSVPTKTVKRVFISFSSGGYSTISLSNIQIEEGDTATTYEPYIGNVFVPQNVQ